jgi:hypothetical protein
MVQVQRLKEHISRKHADGSGAEECSSDAAAASSETASSEAVAVPKPVPPKLPGIDGRHRRVPAKMGSNTFHELDSRTAWRSSLLLSMGVQRGTACVADKHIFARLTTLSLIRRCLVLLTSTIEYLDPIWQP